MKRTWKQVLFGSKKVSWKKRLAFWGCFFGSLALAYYWQPQRFEFFPPEAPEIGRIDPSAVGLFRPGVRVLVVTGHPDDSEFYIGGTLLRIAETGAVSRLVAMTDGDKAYYPFGVPKELTETRRKEQREATREWGGDVVFLGYKDGRLPVNDDTVDDLVEEFEKFKPDVVMSIDPVYRPRITHSDHIDAGRNTLLALKRWGKPCTVMLFNTRAANCFVEIQKYWFGKRGLIAKHKSQFFGDRLEWVTTFLAERAVRDGERSGLDMAEGFRVYSVP